MMTVPKGIPGPILPRQGWPWTEACRPARAGRRWPRVSILTPSFRQGRYIEETIRSVLLQGYPEVEHIVVDGGSQDQTVDVLTRYGAHLAPWVSEKDRGQSDALNKALAKATGEIVGWLNSDDVYCPYAIQRAVARLLDRPEEIMVHGDRVMIDAESRVSGWSVTPPFDPTRHTYSIHQETCFWRRSIHERVGGFRTDLTFAMDLEFFCRLHRLGRFGKIDRFVGCFRCYPDNKSSLIPEIGDAEAQAEWQRFFPAHVGTFRTALPKGRLRHFLAPLLSWRHVGYPYLQRRLAVRPVPVTAG